MNVTQRSRDTITAVPPGLLSAISKVESNLMQNITNLKNEIINLVFSKMKTRNTKT